VKKLLVLLLLVVVAGCSVPNKDLNIFFFKDEKLIAVKRDLPTIENPVLVAMYQLMQGPNDQETASGIMTEIPNGTMAVKVEVMDDTAIINLNSKLTEYQGSTAKAKALVAQIVYTATNVKGIKRVILKLEGSDQFTLGSEGYVIDRPLERSDVKI
jgi:spore germination protein GerM